MPIELNGVAVAMNQAAFDWGRRAAADLAAVQRVASPSMPVVLHLPRTLEALLRSRVEILTRYQNAAYAQRHEAFVRRQRELLDELDLPAPAPAIPLSSMA